MRVSLSELGSNELGDGPFVNESDHIGRILLGCEFDSPGDIEFIVQEDSIFVFVHQDAQILPLLIL